VPSVPLRDKRDFAAFDSQPLKENPATKMRKRGAVPGPVVAKSFPGVIYMTQL
jgi:hypothetical protein